MSEEYTYITATEALEEHLSQLDPASPLFIDCEFQGDDRYFAQPCLIQLGDWDQVLLVDALRVDLDPLIQYLRKSDQVKVLHSSEQDMFIFYRLGVGWLSRVFDTQVAAAFLGYGKVISFGEIVGKICSKRLRKQVQTTNWRQRPLREHQLQYACSDVTLLRPVYQHLEKSLTQKQRWGWFEEIWQERLTSMENVMNPQLAWQRLKIKDRHYQSLNLLQALSAWREEEAQRLDTPRRRVLSDHALLELVDSRPQEKADFSRLRFFPRALRSKADDLLRRIKDSSQTQHNGYAKPKSVILDLKEMAALDLLRLLLRDNARRYEVAADYVAREHDLKTLITGDKNGHKVLTGWRKDVFGNDADKILTGQLAATVGERGITWITCGDKQEQR